MAALPKPTNGSNTDHAARVGALFDVVNGAAALPIAASWTPVLTFATPGNLAVTYSIQRGDKRRIGDLIIAESNIVTSAFTHTTASGVMRITGLADAATADANYLAAGSMSWGGITKAGYTSVVPYVSVSSSVIDFLGNGSAQTPANIAVGDVPTGGTVHLRGRVVYRAA